MRVDYLDVSCAVILDGGGKRILAARRSPDMPHPMKWEFPGGKLKDGESPEKSVVREISEEMNVRIKVLRQMQPVVHHYSAGSIRLIPLLCELMDDDSAIRLSEHVDWKWVPKEKLLDVEWLEADVEVVNQLLTRLRG
jgi:8-oxo-dGTP diphosphatase